MASCRLLSDPAQHGGPPHAADGHDQGGGAEGYLALAHDARERRVRVPHVAMELGVDLVLFPRELLDVLGPLEVRDGDAALGQRLVGLGRRRRVDLHLAVRRDEYALDGGREVHHPRRLAEVVVDVLEAGHASTILRQAGAAAPMERADVVFEVASRSAYPEVRCAQRRHEATRTPVSSRSWTRPGAEA